MHVGEKYRHLKLRDSTAIVALWTIILCLDVLVSIYKNIQKWLFNKEETIIIR